MSTARTRTIVTAAVEFASTARVGWRGEERRGEETDSVVFRSFLHTRV